MICSSFLINKKIIQSDTNTDDPKLNPPAFSCKLLVWGIASKRSPCPFCFFFYQKTHAQLVLLSCLTFFFLFFFIKTKVMFPRKRKLIYPNKEVKTYFVFLANIDVEICKARMIFNHPVEQQQQEQQQRRPGSQQQQQQNQQQQQQTIAFVSTNCHSSR